MLVVTKPVVATWGASAAQVRVTYVKGRRVLRLAGGNAATSVEVSLDDFLHELGIDVAQLAPPHRYLLFASVRREAGRFPRQIVTAFPDEQGAQDAFWALRRGQSHPGDWAEVASVEASGTLRRQWWFGTPWGPGGREDTAPLAPSSAAAPTRVLRAARWGARRRAAEVAMRVPAD